MNHYNTYCPEIINDLNLRSIRYEVHNFPSGNIMIDIWVKNSFYVVQIEKSFIGLSEINDLNPGFDTQPDEKYSDFDQFKIKLYSIIG